MTRRFVAVFATSVALLLSSGAATAADTPAAPTEGKTMWESCTRVGETDRDLCMVKVTTKDSAAGRECEELMGRAQRRCMLDILEGKRPMPGVK